MNRRELNRYGWQFDHVHLEVMKAPPLPRQTDAGLPYCRYKTHGLACRSRQELLSRYQDPLAFLRSKTCPAGERTAR
jgi:hypothetical protein